MSRPGVLIRFIGQPPITATIYELEEAALQFVRPDLHGPGAPGGGRREVR